MFDWLTPILEFDNPVLYAIPFFFLLIGIEIYLSYRERLDHYQWQDSAASISMGLGSVVIDLGCKTVAFYVFTWLYIHTGWFKEQLSYTLLGWGLLFFLDDFIFYWHHRLCHEVRLFWAAHVNHHSSQRYNLTTALRQSWSELFYKYLWYTCLPLLGFPPLMVLTQISINLIYQFWIHTQQIHRLPTWIEWVFNTPAHHRVHHAMNVAYLDRNHGGTLIIWDRLFGTFASEDPDHPVVFGLTTNIHTYNPLRIASHEYAALWRDLCQAPNWSARWRYLFYPPGWSHDGSSQTAEELRTTLSSKTPTPSPLGTEGIE